MLTEILDQEITPELIPTEEGEKPQATEDSVGPYALQDFTLFHVLRRGYRPSKIAFLAWHAWRRRRRGGVAAGLPRGPAHGVRPRRRSGTGWRSSCKRFFASQFKRSALPNGPKVAAGGTMSPRGDWRMPSDARPRAWLAELEQRPARLTERRPLRGSHRPRILLERDGSARVLGAPPCAVPRS